MKRRKGSARMLALNDLASVFKKIESTLNKLRLICDASTYGYLDILLHDGDDLALLVVFGSRPLGACHGSKPDSSR